MTETITGSTPEDFLVNLNSLHALRELRALQAVTNEPALEGLADELRTVVRSDIEQQGLTLEDLARQFHEDLQPIVELGVLIVLMARHEFRLGNSPDAKRRSQVADYLAELNLYLDHIKIFVLYEFADELPPELTEVLRRLPMPAVPEVTMVTGKGDAVKAPALGLEALQPAEEDLGNTPDSAAEEAIQEEAKPPKAVIKKPAAPKALAKKTDKEPAAKPESVDLSDHTELPPEKIISSNLDLLGHIRVTIAGKPVDLKLEEVYALAVFVQNTGEEVRLADHNKSDIMKDITSARNLTSPEAAFTNGLKKLQMLIERNGWPISVKSNGLKARSVRYTFTDDAKAVSFWLPEGIKSPLSERGGTKSTGTQEPDSMEVGQGVGNEADEVNQEDLDEFAINLFGNELLVLFEYVKSSHRGVSISELQNFASSSQLTQFREKLEIWAKKANAFYTVDLGEESGRIKISDIEN